MVLKDCDDARPDDEDDEDDDDQTTEFKIYLDPCILIPKQKSLTVSFRYSSFSWTISILFIFKKKN